MIGGDPAAVSVSWAAENNCELDWILYALTFPSLFLSLPLCLSRPPMAVCPPSEQQAAHDVTNLTSSHAARCSLCFTACQWWPHSCSLYLQASLCRHVVLLLSFSFASLCFKCPGDILSFFSLWSCCSALIVLSYERRPFILHAGVPARPRHRSNNPESGRHGRISRFPLPSGCAHHRNS